MVHDGDLLWTPKAERIGDSNIVALLDWLREHRNVDLADYPALHRWSVQDVSAFWGAMWDYFGIESPTPFSAVLDDPAMPGARWFRGAGVNYAEQVLRYARPGEVAVTYASESAPPADLTWDELDRRVRCLADWLRRIGVGRGDRVVACLPNGPHALVALLATAAVGAVWSSCSPEFGASSVLDRFSQIEPKVLFAVDGYRFAGRDFDRRADIAEITRRLPSLEWHVHVPYLDPDSRPESAAEPVLWADAVPDGADPGDVRFEPTDFSDPLWIVYSSGTTGLPKPIVHGHGGIVLEMSKLLHFHFDLRPGRSMFFYSTTGWVMWNIVVSSLLTGATAVLYDGSPMHPEPDALWRLAEATGATFFGTSPTYVALMGKAGIVPAERYDLSRISGIMLGGSPVTPEAMAWVYENIHDDVWLTSQSGGTDVGSAFVGAAPVLPVHAGWIQCACLGVDVCAYDNDGRPVIGESGELVVRQPMPSMPLYFWNDEDDARYHASYFEAFDGVWTHGDAITFNERGECQIHGRSDSTLNRFGVRIGTSEVYRSVEAVDGVDDSLVVCLNLPDGGFFMPLFVKPAPGRVVDDDLRSEIVHRLRTENSPRHVPDEIYQVDRIPYTLTGKKMEIPVRKLLAGVPVEKAANPDSMADATALDFFVEFGRRNPRP
ncbi:acetoacetate--CoA ligase [Gordonia sp. FQ]|uniref:acetoacetate--CoA ligase n=1 Tax=Gordonia sp. FQ TaxID=3446634 RepID=UPI003F87784F